MLGRTLATRHVVLHVRDALRTVQVRLHLLVLLYLSLVLLDPLLVVCRLRGLLG